MFCIWMPEDASQPEKQVPLLSPSSTSSPTPSPTLTLFLPPPTPPQEWAQTEECWEAEEDQGSSLRHSDYGRTECWAAARASTAQSEDGVSLSGRCPSGQGPHTPSLGLKCGWNTRESNESHC